MLCAGMPCYSFYSQVPEGERTLGPHCDGIIACVEGRVGDEDIDANRSQVLKEGPHQVNTAVTTQGWVMV